MTTVPGRGYAFTAPVHFSAEPSAKSRLPAPRWIVAAVLLLGSLTGVICWRWPAGSDDGPRFVPLTGSDREARPSFSPDGLRIAYDWSADGGSRRSVYVKLLGGSEPVRLSRGFGVSAAWSPDGRHIAYAGDPPGVYVVQSVGGAERRLTSTQLRTTGGRLVAWFPDGKRLAFVDRDAGTGWQSIFELSVESGERRRLTQGKSEAGDFSPAVSPDGKTLGFVRVSSLGGYAIYLAPVAGGEPRQLTRFDERANSFAWTPDGSEIVYSANPDGFRSLWRISIARGIRRRIPAAGDAAFGPAIANTGDHLAFTQRRGKSNLWQIGVDFAASPRQIATTTRVQNNPQYSPDGRLLSFFSNRSGRGENWISDAEGHNLKQVTSSGGVLGKARWSPDGSEIAYAGGPAGVTDIWIAGTEGGRARPFVTHPAEDILPSYSRDGRWLYFAANRTGEFQIWRIARSGGEAVQMTREGGAGAVEDPLGQYIYYLNPLKRGIWRKATAGGPESRVVDIHFEWREYSHLWALSDDGLLYYCSRDDSADAAHRWELTRLNPRTGQRSPVLRLPWGLTALTISPDGRTCVYSQREMESESIMLLENFR